jgi:hypothetical protein
MSALITDREYIQNNFAILQANYQKYAAVNLMVKSKRGRLVRMLFNRIQRRLWQLLLADLKADIPIRWYVVKSRQQGSTSWFLGLLYWLLTMNENMAACMIAHDKEAAKSLGLKMQYLHFKGKKELRPSVRTMNRDQIHFANPLEVMDKTGEVGLDSIVDIFTGDSDGIGRSRTYQFGLITEFGTMADIGVNIHRMMEAVGNCIAEIPGTGIFIETTATGENDAKDFWYDEDNGYRKIFIPRVAEDEYRIDLPVGVYADLSSDPNSKYGDETEEFENTRRALVEWYDEFKQFESNRLVSLQLDHEAHCRIAWRRRMLDRKFFGDYVERRAKFKYEYPTTAEDAFSARSKTIFSIARIMEREDSIRIGKIEPSMWQFDKRATDRVRAFYETKHGNLRVFEEPLPQARYAIGGDAAQGVEDGDHSALVVLKLPSLKEVASINDIIPPYELAGIANYLGLLYNTALLGLEINDKGGHTALDYLFNVLRYPNLWYDPDQDPSNIRYGWITNGITKADMIAEAKHLIADNQVIINSKELISQLKTYVDLGNGKYGALPSKKDDLATAFMIAIQVAKSIHIARPYERPATAPKGSPDYIVQHLKERMNHNQRFKRGH